MAAREDKPARIEHKIVQIISHDNKIYGLSISGNLYEWESRYDLKSEKVINKWNFKIASPIYGNSQEQLLGELAEETLEQMKHSTKK